MPKGTRGNSARLALVPTTTPLLTFIEIDSVLDCYNFLSPHEYSEKTIGLLACLLRKSVGDVNFSEILDEADKRDGQQGQAFIFLMILEERRKNLRSIDASTEKCLMLSRLITYIRENGARFTKILSHIRLDMKLKMTDNQIDRTVQYPADFRQRETDFTRRRNAQELRRLFYFNHTEMKEPPNLIYLQNRITDHLTYLINGRMHLRPEHRCIDPNETMSIFHNSFMIIDQPHVGVNPVSVYERISPGKYRTKVSVVIVMLLHDFMEHHPGIIQMLDIELTLHPPSPYYKLEEPRTIPWQICHLKACPGSKRQMIQYAELSSITIEQTNPVDKRVFFAQMLHTLRFIIRFNADLHGNRYLQPYHMELESLPFAIGAHNSQIPQLLTRIMLSDIQKFSMLGAVSPRIIKIFLLRYFIHRTGVEPNKYVRTFLDQQLTQAQNQRSDFQTVEDIYMDFLVPFIQQVEFMGKHPFLAMFYAEGYFLGSCDSARATEVMEHFRDKNSPKFQLRFESIKVDYAKINGQPVKGRSIAPNLCAVRVDIYNANGLQKQTFNPAMPITHISKFVSRSNARDSDRIRILSDFDDENDTTSYKFYSEFYKYYDPRLDEISKTNEEYELLTDLINAVLIENAEETPRIDVNDLHPPTPHSPTRTEHPPIQNVHTDQLHDHRLAKSKQELIQYVLSESDLYAELLHQLSSLNLIITPQQQQGNEEASTKRTVNQTIDDNQSECESMNQIDSTSAQDPTQIEILQTTEDYLSQADLDILELLSTNQMSERPITEDSQLSLNELPTDTSSSQDEQ